MLWHRQAIFESKGDKLSSSAEGRIRTQDLRYLFTSRLNACWQTDWAIEDQAKTWTRQPVPMISKHSAHSTLLPIGFRTWLWRYTYLLLLISMLWHRQAIFESKGDKLSSSAEGRIRTQDLRYLFTSRLNGCWQTDWAIEDQAKTWTRQPVPMISKHSAHSTLLPIGFRTWLWRYTYLLLLISMLWHRQAIFESKGDKLSSSAEGRIIHRDCGSVLVKLHPIIIYTGTVLGSARFLCWMPLVVFFGFTNCALLYDNKTNTRMLVTLGIHFKQHFDTRYFAFCNLSPSRMFLPLDLLSEYRIHYGTIGPLHFTSRTLN